MTDTQYDTTQAARVLIAGVSTLPVDSRALMTELVTAAHGAVVGFDGIVRDHDEGRSVLSLRYSAHPSADEVIRSVAADVAARHPQVTLAVVHRIGDLAIGDSALACAVASAHRAEAFTACAELVDLIKERAPIWKDQHFTDGTSEWVNAIG